MTQPYLNYCQNSATQNLNYTEQILLALNQSVIQPETIQETVQGYLAMIWVALKEITPKSIDDAYVTQVFSFLDTALLEKIATQLTTASEADWQELGKQALYVATAMGVVSEIKPYSPEEFTALLDDAGAVFHESHVIVTLGYIILTGDPSYSSQIMRLLSQDYNPDLSFGYEWVDALMMGLLIHAAWQYFPTLSERDRQYLLQRFFYRAIISSVPVRDWLAQTYESRIDSTQVNALFQPLLASLELVPTNIDLSANKKFGEIMKEFITVVSREQISTLAQEQFLNKWYVNTPTGQLFRAWLRESLGIINRIQTNTLAQ